MRPRPSTAPAPAPVPAAELGADARARPVLVDRLAHWVLSIFFREVEVVGADRVPRDRALVYVGNHNNGLLDPALLLGFMPVAPRFLGKSTLWKMAILRPFLKLSAAIPVYRRQDAGVDTSKNQETFTRCHEVLAASGAIALFPEGRSHDEPSLVELKTGVSRIVLEAEKKFAGLGSRILPVGLTFDDKTRFRSRVMILIGEPVDPAAELATYADDPRQAVRQLTERIGDALAEVTLNYPSWREGRWIERAAEIYANPASSHDEDSSDGLSDSFPLRKAFIEGYGELLRQHPEEVAAVAQEVRQYSDQLDAFQLTDEQVAARYPAGDVVRFTLKSLWLLLVRLPLGALGTVLNFVPYQAAGWVARRFADTADTQSTYKVMPSLIFYPATWLLLTVLAAWWGGLWPALATLVAGPVSGLFAIRFHHRRELFLRQARAFFLLRMGGRCIEDLRRRRRQVATAVQNLADVYLAGRKAPAGHSPDPTL